jgi:hypothetical protein
MKNNKLIIILLLIIIFSITGLQLRCGVPIKEYAPKEGDIIFQSLYENDLVKAIEGITLSPYSHCGILFKKRNCWYVIEAIGPVKETGITEFVRRGRNRNVDIYRLDTSYHNLIPEFIQELKTYSGRPYDIMYEMDDEKIYCSELIYKAFQKIYNEDLGEAKKLGDMNWGPYANTIRHYEDGPVPVERLIISPKAVSEANQLHLIHRGINPE